MKTEFEPEEIRALATEVAKILHGMQQENGKGPLVDIGGLAEHLNVPKSWVYEKTRDKSNGSIPRVNVGKYVRFNIHEVLEWLKS